MKLLDKLKPTNNKEETGDKKEKQLLPVKKEDNPILKIHMPNTEKDVYAELGRTQIRRVYNDDIGARLLIIIDEATELLQPTGVKSEAGKEEDGLKQEISMIVQSITQLGRAAGVHVALAMQRNDKAILNGVIQNNALSLSTKVLVRRLCEKSETKAT